MPSLIPFFIVVENLSGISKRIKMARVRTYLNFPRSTEQAFLFYTSVFNTEFSAPYITIQ